MKKTNMYSGTQTWNPFKGCEFDCLYCRPSFQAQAKRQKRNCEKCYRYEPHEHPERLNRIPNKQTIFVCGNGDLSFCDPAFTWKIIESINKKARPGQEFYLQSKQPEYFKQFLLEEDSVSDKVDVIKAQLEAGTYKMPSDDELAEALLSNADFRGLMGL